MRLTWIIIGAAVLLAAIVWAYDHTKINVTASCMKGPDGEVVVCPPPFKPAN